MVEGGINLHDAAHYVYCICVGKGRLVLIFGFARAGLVFCTPFLSARESKLLSVSKTGNVSGFSFGTGQMEKQKDHADG